MSKNENTSQGVLIGGADYLTARPDFKLVGREKELQSLSGILMRKKANSVLLTGPGGVGCTALCMGLEACKDDPEAPFDIVSKRFFWLDVDRLFASGDSATINGEFKKMIATLNRTPDSVLIVEDMRDFVEAARNNNCTHFINALTLAVKTGKTQMIVEAQDDDLDMILKCHSDMHEAFTLMDLQEPSGEALDVIVADGAKGLESHHGIRISPQAIKTAIELTNKYRTSDASLSRAQPERAITLLDRALTSYRLNSHKMPPEVAMLEARQKALRAAIGGAQFTPELQGRSPEDLQILQAALDSDIQEAAAKWQSSQNEIRILQADICKGEEVLIDLNVQLDEQLRKEEELRTKPGITTDEDLYAARPPAKNSRINAFSIMTSGAGFDSDAVKEIKDRIKLFEIEMKKRKDRYEDVIAGVNRNLLLDHDQVLAKFSQISGISASKLNQNEREKLLHLEDSLGKRVFGQEDPVKRLADAIITARISRKNRTKPQASFMYLGPSGVGKTELAKALAGILLDDEAALTRFDMSEYMEKHAVAKLIGAPPGYEGFEAGGILTNAIRKNPYRILLFDEIEKAHPDVFNIFLQIIDDGRLTDNVGRTVSFENTIVIMTTNTGQPYFLDKSLSFEEAKEKAMEDLNGMYRGEFLNRFNGRENILCFNRLDLPTVEKIVGKKIRELDACYGEQGMHIDMKPEQIKAFCADRYDPARGARGPVGFIESNMEPTIARALLVNPDATGTMKVEYSRETRGFIVSPVQAPVLEQNNNPAQSAPLIASFNHA